MTHNVLPTGDSYGGFTPLWESYPIPPFSFEESFKGSSWIVFTQEHAEIPIFAVSLYLAFVFWCPNYMENREPFKIRTLFALWNLLLSVFSICGALRIGPYLLWVLYEKGFEFSICENSKLWYVDNQPGLWVALFIYSKIPELIDTVFLVVQKKPVIFLHWFHHTTVLLYCWHSYHHAISPGLWFIGMNYTVHSVMYAYYFCMIVGWKSTVKRIAPIITSMQLIQMIIGSTVTGMSGFYLNKYGKEKCHVDPANYKLGLGMYLSYAILFGMLFKKLYLTPKKRASSTSASPQKKDKDYICGVKMANGNESGGLFHPDEKESRKEQ